MWIALTALMWVSNPPSVWIQPGSFGAATLEAAGTGIGADVVAVDEADYQLTASWEGADRSHLAHVATLRWILHWQTPVATTESEEAAARPVLSIGYPAAFEWECRDILGVDGLAEQIAEDPESFNLKSYQSGAELERLVKKGDIDGYLVPIDLIELDQPLAEQAELTLDYFWMKSASAAVSDDYPFLRVVIEAAAQPWPEQVKGRLTQWLSGLGLKRRQAEARAVELLGNDDIMRPFSRPSEAIPSQLHAEAMTRLPALEIDLGLHRVEAENLDDEQPLE